MVTCGFLAIRGIGAQPEPAPVLVWASPPALDYPVVLALGASDNLRRPCGPSELDHWSRRWDAFACPSLSLDHS
jgi:hypothetical protein